MAVLVAAVEEEVLQLVVAEDLVEVAAVVLLLVAEEVSRLVAVD